MGEIRNANVAKQHRAVAFDDRAHGFAGFAARAEPIKVGQPAPEIELPATTGGEIKLSDFRGKKMVLVEFYHTDWGPTCMANLEARRDEYDKFEELNIQVLGISLDHAYSQAAFADSIELPYPLLSDYPNGRTVKDYGVDYYEGQAERLFARPSFFLVDMEGVVRGYWGQRPKNSDEILAPDPLISSAPMLEAAQQIAAAE